MPNRKKVKILYTLVVPTMILGLAAIFPGCGDKTPPTTQKADLEVWGVFEDSDVFNPLINEFNKTYKNVNITYYKKTFQNYEQDLLEAMAAGGGPDVLMIHHTWLPRYMNKILYAPVDLITFTEVKDEFVDVVLNDFVSEGYVYALPLNVDTLALFYNKDIFNTKGVPQPPATWEKFLETVEKITTKDEEGNIVLSGAAIGTAENVNRATDILSLLMLQSGAQMVDVASERATFQYPVIYNGEDYYVGERATQFYTDFANPLKMNYTWDDQMHYSIDAFVEGNVAMMFNYSYTIPTIRAKSPYLNFDMASMPQVETAEFDVNYANYWGLAVSRNTKEYEMAWQFVRWLTSAEGAQMYLQLSGRPAARRDLIAWQSNDPDLGVFAKQSLTAYSWYQIDNIKIEEYLTDMIKSIVRGEMDIQKALGNAAEEITYLMK